MMLARRAAPQSCMLAMRSSSMSVLFLSVVATAVVFLTNPSACHTLTGFLDFMQRAHGTRHHRPMQSRGWMTHRPMECAAVMTRAVRTSSDGANIAKQWRADRRERLLASLDWSRYHLQVCFVDAIEPSHGTAAITSFFFNRICKARGADTLLLCEAGGVSPVHGSEDVLTEPPASLVPGLTVSDRNNLALPVEEFEPGHIDLYDVVVASDEETCDLLRRRLADEGLDGDADHICVLGDYLDAYDVMLMLEQSQGAPEENLAVISPGVLTVEGVKALKDGKITPGPLRGAPQAKSVGTALGGLPLEWGELLAASPTDDMLLGATPPGSAPAGSRQHIGGVLRSTIGLQRVLAASVPKGMRWWNDEE
eukprot:TRINITY_DN19243_c0_g1_i1.p1 TRINITY_DN19243_c0_g1~~TRINITY_DN19243_c0_g1_i1.p1  ORF type:complete len:366 (-),score=56.16 TRINITY_DN19243_c0_g1_i1:251-1348(-)